MIQRTSTELHRLHLRLHVVGIPHNCHGFRREERELQRSELAASLSSSKDGDCPAYCWVWYPHCEN